MINTMFGRVGCAGLADVEPGMEGCAPRCANTEAQLNHPSRATLNASFTWLVSAPPVIPAWMGVDVCDWVTARPSRGQIRQHSASPGQDQPFRFAIFAMQLAALSTCRRIWNPEQGFAVRVDRSPNRRVPPPTSA